MRTLKSEQRSQFEAEGFLAYGPFLCPERIKQLGDAIDAIAGGEIDYPEDLIRWEPKAAELTGSTERKNLVYQIRYPHRHVPLFFEHATDPRILDAVEDLLGPDLVLYNTQALLKPAYHGAPQPWHQDSAYWPIRPFQIITCWIALDEATVENGCMRFIPRSHKLGLLPHQAGRALSHASGGTSAVVQQVEVDEAKATPVPAKPGCGSFHHCLTLHGTTANTTPFRRRAIISHYMPLGFSYTGPAEEKPAFHIVRGSRAGEAI